MTRSHHPRTGSVLPSRSAPPRRSTSRWTPAAQGETGGDETLGNAGALFFARDRPGLSVRGLIRRDPRRRVELVRVDPIDRNGASFARFVVADLLRTRDRFRVGRISVFGPSSGGRNAAMPAPSRSPGRLGGLCPGAALGRERLASRVPVAARRDSRSCSQEGRWEARPSRRIASPGRIRPF